MDELTTTIAQADEQQIYRILEEVRYRFEACYPDWELHILTVQKGLDRDGQIDSVIRMLEGLKTLEGVSRDTRKEIPEDQ